MRNFPAQRRRRSPRDLAPRATRKAGGIGPSCGGIAIRDVKPIGKEATIVHVLGNVRIEQLERFIGVFSTAGAEARGRHGSRGAQLFEVAGEEGRVVVLLEWESEEAFEAFRNDPSVKETMKASGTVGPPEFTMLKKVGEFPS